MMQQQVNFDTHSVFKKFDQAGIPAIQAEVIIEAIQEARQADQNIKDHKTKALEKEISNLKANTLTITDASTLATKADLLAFKADLVAIESKIERVEFELKNEMQKNALEMQKLLAEMQADNLKREANLVKYLFTCSIGIIGSIVAIIKFFL